MTHAIERTSPKGPGQKFEGYCIKCGQAGLTVVSATEVCPADDVVSDEKALLELMAPKHGVSK